MATRNLHKLEDTFFFFQKTHRFRVLNLESDQITKTIHVEKSTIDEIDELCPLGAFNNYVGKKKGQ